MLEKIKNIFNNKEKRVENLISFLIILVITLIVINKILKVENTTNKEDMENTVGIELANQGEKNELKTTDLENRIEKILSQINGVGKVSVLLTYSQSSTLVPIYNINSSTSTTEEKDTSGGTRTIETQNNQKDIVTDSNSNVITEKIIMPVIEGAIVIAQGVDDITVKSNIISAVEAVTGLANHKIQVFEMGDD